MNFIVNGKIVLPNEISEGKALAYSDKIEGIIDIDKIPKEANIIDAGGGYVTPGLIDTHIHGYLGEDTSDGKIDGVRTMAKGVVENGVTSFLPTTMTVPMDEINQALDNVRALKSETEKSDFMGARILGVNLEGPFINPSKKGAQKEDNIKKPSADFIEKNADIIRVATIATEMDEGLNEVKKMVNIPGVHISLGHTDATFEQAMAAFEAGVDRVTHLFNAQTPLHHRKPGVVGAALTSPVYTELIADTFHVHKGLFQLIANNKKDKLVLITDCTRAGGMPDGEYSLGGQPIFVKGIQCLLADGTIAGSVLKLNNAVKNLKDNTNLTLWECVNAASLNPAKSIGADELYGSIEQGKIADLVIMDEFFNVKTTIIGGVIKYEA